MAARVVLGLVLAVVFATPAHAALGVNLLSNGNAEAGPGATDSTSQPPVPDWRTTGDFTVMQYGTYGFADAPDGGGKNMFVGGPSSSDSTATQVVDVSDEADAIDQDTRRATLSALLGGFAGQDDDGVVEAHFLDGNQAEIGQFSIGPVSASDRNDQTGLLPRSRSHLVPSGTRSIVVVIAARKASGTYNDGYIDNVVLKLGEGTGRSRWFFGFRVVNIGRQASFGSNGAFTTKGQPNHEGELRVRTVAAKPFSIRWTYKGHKHHVRIEFLPGGTFSPATGDLTLNAQVVRTDLHGCTGDEAELSFSDTDVFLRYCGAQARFRVPGQATYHVKAG